MMKRKFLALMMASVVLVGATAPASVFATEGSPAPNSSNVLYGDESETESNPVYHSITKGSTYTWKESAETPEKEADTSCEVTVTVGSTFTVAIPKKIELDVTGTTGSHDYNVDVYGDIAGNETISVTPASEVTMKQTGKSDLTGKVTQKVTKFLSPSYSTSLSGIEDTILMSLTAPSAVGNGRTTGNVKVENLTSGTWDGTFNFTITDTTANSN
jgi:hypothetical protein